VALGLLSSAATRIAGPPLSAAGRRVLLETARRTGLTGLGEGHPEGEGHLG
jgi:hypothetical protein